MKMPLELVSLKIFDLHCDTFSELFDRRLSFENNVTAINSNELLQFEEAVISFAVFLHPEISDSLKRYTDVISYGRKCLETAGVKNILSVEGGVPNFDVKNIERLYRDGVRTVSLTWNYDNPFGSGALGDGGLTALGRQAVSEFNRFNMVTDLSHLNRKTFFEAIDVAEAAVSTHSGVNSIVKHPRNLTDRQLTLIKEKNGIVGLCVYTAFIGENPFEGFYKAVMHCLDLGLENNIALGTDFDGAVMHPKLSRASQLIALFEYLVEKGVEKSVCEKIFFENSKHFYNRVLTNSVK